jgi:hypothetical protein
MLLTIWLPSTARGTRDLDLLGFGDASEQRIRGFSARYWRSPAMMASVLISTRCGRNHP